MNERDGTVVRIENGLAWVRTSGRLQSCGACSRQQACGLGSKPGLLDQRQDEHLICLPVNIAAKPGDHVSIQLPDGQVLHAVWKAYTLPLILALCLGCLANVFSAGNDLVVGASVIFGLVVGFLRLKNAALDINAITPTSTFKLKVHS